MNNPVDQPLALIHNLLHIDSGMTRVPSVSEALTMIVECTSAAVECEITVFGKIDWEANEIHFTHHLGALADRFADVRVAISANLLDLIESSKSPLILSDASDTTAPDEIMAGRGLQNALTAAIGSDEKPYGLLVIGNRIGGAFSAADAKLIETIVRHGAAAIGRIELNQRAHSAFRELEQQKTHIETVLSQLGDGVVVSDAQGNITMINSAAERIVGDGATRFIGMNIVDIHREPHRKEVNFVLKQLARSKPDTGVYWEQNVQLPGNKTARINMRPVFLKDGTFAGVATLMQDITDIVELETAKTEFLSMVAHELRTPLTALNGSIGLILDGSSGEIDSTLKDMMSIAECHCKKLIRLVDDMLDIARMKSGHLGLEMDIVSVQERVLSAVKQMQHYAEERQVKLVTKVIGEPPEVVGDGDRIEQVVTNLLSNAIRFSPENSSVEITVRFDRGTVRVSVSDRGPGIPPKEQKRVFEKFYQIAGREQTGCRSSGLGLAISKGIVEQHGGQMMVRSELGRGSTLSFVLPIPGDEELLLDE